MRNDFTNMKPRVATKEEAEKLWGVNQVPLSCNICGSRIKEGDVWRFQGMGGDDLFVPGTKDRIFPNIMVCENCDGDVSELHKKLCDIYTEYMSPKFDFIKRWF